uniref:(California timema) hypothetical protein n=1 Tax=Timema californicum TaxID=61474 RepID=A0A7R9JKR0_TIMCA|nr:unnamed protein product [Timema californicum]
MTEGTPAPASKEDTAGHDGWDVDVTNSTPKESSLLIQEVALRVSHSSLMSSDRMKPRSGNWAFCLFAMKQNIPFEAANTPSHRMKS